jgi:hypothetical protein
VENDEEAQEGEGEAGDSQDAGDTAGCTSCGRTRLWHNMWDKARKLFLMRSGL